MWKMLQHLGTTIRTPSFLHPPRMWKYRRMTAASPKPRAWTSAQKMSLAMLTSYHSSSLQAQYSTHTPKQSIYYWQTYIEPHVSASEKIVSAKGKRTANATPTSQTTMATIMLRSDSSTAETPTSSVRGGALMTGETAPDSTDLVPSTMGSVPATTATEPTPTNASNSEPHRMPPMSIALLVISGIVIVVVSLLGLGCWMKRRRRPRSVNEMVAVEEEMDELHELGQQYTKSRTYRSVSRNTNRSSRIFPSRSASRATNASRTTNSSSSTNASRKTKASSSTISSTSSRPHQSIPRTTTLVEPSAK